MTPISRSAAISVFSSVWRAMSLICCLVNIKPQQPEMMKFTDYTQHAIDLLEQKETLWHLTSNESSSSGTLVSEGDHGEQSCSKGRTDQEIINWRECVWDFVSQHSSYQRSEIHCCLVRELGWRNSPASSIRGSMENGNSPPHNYFWLVLLLICGPVSVSIFINHSDWGGSEEREQRSFAYGRDNVPLRKSAQVELGIRLLEAPITRVWLSLIWTGR